MKIFLIIFGCVWVVVGIGVAIYLSIDERRFEKLHPSRNVNDAKPVPLILWLMFPFFWLFGMAVAVIFWQITWSSQKFAQRERLHAEFPSHYQHSG